MKHPWQINIDIQASEYNVEKIDRKPKLWLLSKVLVNEHSRFHLAKSKWKIEHWWHRFLKENTNKNDFKSVINSLTHTLLIKNKVEDLNDVSNIDYIPVDMDPKKIKYSPNIYLDVQQVDLYWLRR
jgi:hypothetical protein